MWNAVGKKAMATGLFSFMTGTTSVNDRCWKKNIQQLCFRLNVGLSIIGSTSFISLCWHWHAPQLKYIWANVAPSISRWLIVPLKDNFLFLNNIFTNDTILPLLQTGQLGARFHMNLIIKGCLFSNHRGGRNMGKLLEELIFYHFNLFLT